MRQPKARGAPGGLRDREEERREAPRGDGWRGQLGAAWSGRCRAFLRPACWIVPAPGLRMPVPHPSQTRSADGASLVFRGRPPPLWRREMSIRRRRWGGGLRPRAATRPPSATGPFPHQPPPSGRRSAAKHRPGTRSAAGAAGEGKGGDLLPGGNHREPPATDSPRSMPARTMPTRRRGGAFTTVRRTSSLGCRTGKMRRAGRCGAGMTDPALMRISPNGSAFRRSRTIGVQGRNLLSEVRRLVARGPLDVAARARMLPPCHRAAR